MDSSILDNLTEIINSLYSFLYQPFALPIILVLIGAWLTVRTGFVQIRHFGLALRTVLAGVLHRQKGGTGTITPFQALSTALASTVGNGNIGGSGNRHSCGRDPELFSGCGSARPLGWQLNMLKLCWVFITG